jgi:hypothetical protein
MFEKRVKCRLTVMNVQQNDNAAQSYAVRECEPKQELKKETKAI